jgi:hypothetical protein
MQRARSRHTCRASNARPGGERRPQTSSRRPEPPAMWPRRTGLRAGGRSRALGGDDGPVDCGPRSARRDRSHRPPDLFPHHHCCAGYSFPPIGVVQNDPFTDQDHDTDHGKRTHITTPLVLPVLGQAAVLAPGAGWRRRGRQVWGRGQRVWRASGFIARRLMSGGSSPLATSWRLTWSRTALRLARSASQTSLRLVAAPA